MLKIVLYVIQLLVCLTLIVGVLLQPGKSAGLSGSIAGGAEQLFGKKKGKSYEQFAAKVTTVAAIVFMVLSVVLLLVR